MYLSKKASRARLREAENARRNRLEIVKALSVGEITRRDLFRWGLFTTTGYLAAKNGLSLYAQSAYGAVPTGTPPSPSFGATKFSQPFQRLVLQPKMPLVAVDDPAFPDEHPYHWTSGGERLCKLHSWHDEFDHALGTEYFNPVTLRGPCEGRPPGEMFKHQRWTELSPHFGYLLSIGQVKAGSKFHPLMPEQGPNAVWSFGQRAPGLVGNVAGTRTGGLVPPLIKMRYGESVIARIYNDLPVDRAVNGGFGRNEVSTHFHNAHNGAESDGACNAFHFPGTFYDYHWSAVMARRDNPELWPTTVSRYLDRASGPDDNGGLVRVPGDFREIQGTMWFHDHRFFFTAENVHKGMFGMINMYSGPDRGSDTLEDGINLRLPSGHANSQGWGNTDFDVNLAISNPATDQQGQLFFDIFDTDGFVGDILAVNGTYYPYMEVLPRRYRFRILNASMARFLKLTIAVNRSTRFARGTRLPFHFIANDGNFVVSPLKMLELDAQGVAERYDIVIDFSQVRPGDSLYLVNLMKQTSGRKPDGPVTVATALAGVALDPGVGPVMEFRVVNRLQSVDDPAKTYDMTSTADRDQSADLNAAAWTLRQKTLTTQIPVVAPVREREIEFGRSGDGDSRDTDTGQCIPDCGDVVSFPWSIKVNGQAAHTANANRISALIPRPGEVEHWTLINGGGGWDHPIHLHFEEAVTINRGTDSIPATERLVRKDIWRLRPSGRVKIQIRFGDFGGAYVNHCHNTTHEDFAMLIRYQLLAAPQNDPRARPEDVLYQVSMTPMPTPDGVTFKQPEILPEAMPGFIRPPGT
jgi:FtsP/CotA-like multicopper oxidase with cupredoxin domain